MAPNHRLASILRHMLEILETADENAIQGLSGDIEANAVELASILSKVYGEDAIAAAEKIYEGADDKALPKRVLEILRDDPKIIH